MIIRLLLPVLLLQLFLGCSSTDRSAMNANDMKAERLTLEWLKQVDFREADNPHAAVTAPASQPDVEDWIRRGEKIEGIATALDRLLKERHDGTDPAQVAYALGWLGNWRSTPVLVGALESRDVYVRIEAAAALGRVGDTRAVDPLCNCLANDPSSNVRANAALALSRFDSNDAKRCLEVAASKDKSLFVRDIAAKALHEITNGK
jgi:hypothetical protein